MLNPFEPLFPLRGHHRGTQIFRQNRNQSRRFFGWIQRLRLLFAPAHDKSHIDQLFQRPCAGCRRSQPFAFSILRRILCACRFHRRQQRIFGVTLRRGRLSLADRRYDRSDRLSDFKRRDGVFLLFPLSAAQAPAKCFFKHPVAHLSHSASLCRKIMPFAVQRHRHFIRFAWFARRRKQPHRQQG